MELHRLVIAACALVPAFVVAGCDETAGPSSSVSAPSVQIHTARTPDSSTTFTPTTSTPLSVAVTTTTTMPHNISGFSAQSVSFVTAGVGFVLGDVACPKSACLALRETTNRGVSWTAMTPPPAALGESAYSAGPELHFADALNGWAYGATLWATHDGAIQWREVNLGGTVLAMASGAGEVYALVEPCDSSALSCSASGRLYRSPVGQDSWTEAPSISGQLIAGQYGLVVENHSVFVWTAYPKPELLALSGGVHFVSLPVPCPTGIDDGFGPFNIEAIAAIDPSDIAVLCVGPPSMEGDAERAYLSHDGGYAFQSLPDPAVGFAGDLAMPSPNMLLLAGGLVAGSWVFRISAGSSSWSESVGFGGQETGVSDMAFVDPSDGALVLADTPSGSGEVYLTNDDGSSWHALNIPA